VVGSFGGFIGGSPLGGFHLQLREVLLHKDERKGGARGAPRGVAQRSFKKTNLS